MNVNRRLLISLIGCLFVEIFLLIFWDIVYHQNSFIFNKLYLSSSPKLNENFLKKNLFKLIIYINRNIFGEEFNDICDKLLKIEDMKRLVCEIKYNSNVFEYLTENAENCVDKYDFLFLYKENIRNNFLQLVPSEYNILFIPQFFCNYESLEIFYSQNFNEALLSYPMNNKSLDMIGDVVELLFKSLKVDNGYELKWINAKETIFSYFFVLESSDFLITFGDNFANDYEKCLNNISDLIY
jgi:hypothetical protein